MRRRAFLRCSLAGGLTVTIAGCSTSNDSENDPTDSSPTAASGTPTGATETPEEGTEDDQQTEPDSEPVARYVFDDKTGALGYLGADDVPEDAEHVITNTTTEAQYREMQRNDREYPEGLEDGQLTMSVDEMITRAEEIYSDPDAHIDTLGYDDLDFAEEDDEIVFTRALIQASQEAGVNSSGLADIVVANMAEAAVQAIQPGFTNFKLSTLRATEPIAPGRQGHSGGVRENEYNQKFGNSGFRHMAALLQYDKDGDTVVKYAEQTNAVNVNTFRRVIRDPEFSLYRSRLDQDTVDNARNSEPGDGGTMFPEHYVTALDYTKARELERSEDGFFRFGMNDDGGYNSLGDYLIQTLMQSVDDMGVTGYDNNPDRKNIAAPADGKLVSDSFGESIEEYVTNPNSELRAKFNQLSRGIFQIFQQEGWNTSIAITGTLEDPDILPTDQATVNAVRQDQAYDQVRERVTD